jgi:hypothetical protein
MNFKNAVSKAALAARAIRAQGKLTDSDTEAFMRAYTNAHLKGQRKGWNQDKITRRAKARFWSYKIGMKALKSVSILDGTLGTASDIVGAVADKLIERGKA